MLWSIRSLSFSSVFNRSCMFANTYHTHTYITITLKETGSPARMLLMRQRPRSVVKNTDDMTATTTMLTMDVWTDLPPTIVSVAYRTLNLSFLLLQLLPLLPILLQVHWLLVIPLTSSKTSQMRYGGPLSATNVLKDIESRTLVVKSSSTRFRWPRKYAWIQNDEHCIHRCTQNNKVSHRNYFNKSSTTGNSYCW